MNNFIIIFVIGFLVGILLFIFFGLQIVGVWIFLVIILLAVIRYIIPSALGDTPNVQKGMKLLKLITSLILIFIGILGVGCGGFFTIGLFFDNYFGPEIILLFSVPSLFIGLGIFFLGYKTLGSIRKAQDINNMENISK